MVPGAPPEQVQIAAGLPRPREDCLYRQPAAIFQIDFLNLPEYREDGSPAITAGKHTKVRIEAIAVSNLA